MSEDKRKEAWIAECQHDARRMEIKDKDIRAIIEWMFEYKSDHMIPLGFIPLGFAKFAPGERVRKIKGSSWQGHVCGYYRTGLTSMGYCVESEREPGSVQIYPESALESIDERPLYAERRENLENEGVE